MSTNYRMNQKRGIVETIVLIVVGLIILGYFKINFQSVVNAPVVKENLQYVFGLFVSVFHYITNSILGIFQHNTPA